MNVRDALIAVKRRVADANTAQLAALEILLNASPLNAVDLVAWRKAVPSRGVVRMKDADAVRMGDADSEVESTPESPQPHNDPPDTPQRREEIRKRLEELLKETQNA